MLQHCSKMLLELVTIGTHCEHLQLRYYLKYIWDLSFGTLFYFGLFDCPQHSLLDLVTLLHHSDLELTCKIFEY